MTSKNKNCYKKCMIMWKNVCQTFPKHKHLANIYDFINIFQTCVINIFQTLCPKNRKKINMADLGISIWSH